MNNIFEKNIKALETKDKGLAQKLRDYVVTDVPLLVRENGSYNLIYKGKYLHNKENPLGEAREIFSMAKNEPVSIHVIYGMGLGYLFQVASANSAGTVVLYESDLNILKIAFTLVDFSQDILKPNVFIAADLDKAGEYIHQKSNTQNSPYMLITTAYRELCGAGLGEFVEKLQRMIGSYMLDLKYTKQKFYPLLVYLLQNIPHLVKEPPLTSIKDLYKGKTAVVVSAGPSLDRDIEVIKKYRNKFVLFVVGTAMKTLAKHNITPDYLCLIESYDSSRQIEGIDLSKVNLITEPYSHPNLRKFKFKNIYSHISANMPINLYWADVIGENADEYLSKGTVSYTAINSARILGCSRIIVVGQDLAYLEGQCYSKDSAYKDLVCAKNPQTGRWEIIAKDFEAFAKALSNSEDEETRKKAGIRRLASLNNSLYYVKSIKGEMIPTESVYAAFITPLCEYTEKFNDREYINASMEGAQIDGFKNMPLKDALEGLSDLNIEEAANTYNYNMPVIKERLQQDLNVLRQDIPKLEKGKSMLKSFNNDLKRQRNITPEILKSLKKISEYYLYMSSDCTKESKLLDFITIADRINLDYEMKMARTLTSEIIGNIIGKMNVFFDNAEKRINRVSGIMQKSIEEI